MARILALADRQQVPPAGAPPSSAPVEAAGQSVLSGAVTVVADDLTNSIFVRSSDEDFAVVNEALQQIDVRPLQVLIEVLIVEAQSTKSFSLGADLFLPAKGPDGSVEARVGGAGWATS